MSIKKLQGTYLFITQIIDLLNPSPRLIPKEKPVNAPVTKQSPQSLQKSLSHNNMNQRI